MRILMTLTAAIIATTAVASSASARGTIGCDPGEANASINARQCSVFNHSDAAFAPRAYASTRKSRAAARRGSYGAAPQNHFVPGRY